MSLNSKLIQTQEDFNALLELSQSQPVMLFKFSPVCPVSQRAAHEHDGWKNIETRQISSYEIDVIGARLVSNAIAEQSGGKHESPQALLFHKGQVVWHASHWDLTSHAFFSAANKVLDEKLSPEPIDIGADI
jgi:bacillithiol system protein YtxJ